MKETKSYYKMHFDRFLYTHTFVLCLIEVIFAFNNFDIARQVTGKFSVRIVPNQTPEIVEKVVVDYCNKIWSKRKSPNKECFFKPWNS